MRSTGDYHLSSDILQESFTRYLEKYGEEELSTTLLYTIARNAVIDGYRKKDTIPRRSRNQETPIPTRRRT